jgi:hypothetical protein
MVPPLLLLLLLVTPVAQLPSDHQLAMRVNALDQELFGAFNTCDLEKFQSLLDPNVEFFHDKNGLSTGARVVTDQVKQNVCGKVRRELVPDSVEVFPMDGFGALQTGRHRFYNPAASTTPSGEARFIHLWRNTSGNWQLFRVISFDH